jgi:hypothetical protein
MSAADQVPNRHGRLSRGMAASGFGGCSHQVSLRAARATAPVTAAAGAPRPKGASAS